MKNALSKMHSGDTFHSRHLNLGGGGRVAGEPQGRVITQLQEIRGEFIHLI